MAGRIGRHSWSRAGASGWGASGVSPCKGRSGAEEGAALFRRRTSEVEERLRAAWQELLDPATAG